MEYEKFKAKLIISIAKCMSVKELADTLEEVTESMKKYIKEQEEGY